MLRADSKRKAVPEVVGRSTGSRVIDSRPTIALKDHTSQSPTLPGSSCSVVTVEHHQRGRAAAASASHQHQCQSLIPTEITNLTTCVSTAANGVLPSSSSPNVPCLHTQRLPYGTSVKISRVIISVTFTMVSSVTTENRVVEENLPFSI